MRFLDSWWASLVYLCDFSTLSTWSDRYVHQETIQVIPAAGSAADGPVFRPHLSSSDKIDLAEKPGIISPPYSGVPIVDYPGNEIQCNYSSIFPEWKPCNDPTNRGCWLKNRNGTEFNITTDYENLTPQGITRKYVLDIATKALAPDGVPMAHGKVFNGSYPGPWIQACWGDTLEITVRNHLRFNGTTIHWHGIRQINTTEHDGVNGVTQCPIAPGHEFTYKFKAVQYGSSWYHSHYSLQYADGLVGPMTIYGPSSANYTKALDPILMTDWNHRSAFEDWSYSLQPGKSRPLMTNIFLNGQGRYIDPSTKEPVVETQRYTRILEKGVRYLLRLINTSVDTTFVFVIDGHNLTVIGADFVPIEPYNTSSILIGIGQRYHVILTANPIVPSPDDNYWIRTIPSKGCGDDNFFAPPLNNTGILRYKPNDKDPVTRYDQNINTNCSDEPYKLLRPVLKWEVGQPSNEDFGKNNTFDVGLQPINGHPYHPEYDRSLWDMDNMPLWLDFGKPSILNLNTPNNRWRKYLNVVTYDQPAKNWVYLVITGGHVGRRDPNRQFLPLAHPIHLHGHDFALLNQSTTPYPGWNKVTLNLKNPPRRDVALLPSNGYLVIAFKADNPGTWVIHCHIAWHASSGLGMQILENTAALSARLTAANKTNPVPIQADLVDTCNAWDDWVGDVRNHYDPFRPDAFQDDSGI